MRDHGSSGLDVSGLEIPDTVGYHATGPVHVHTTPDTFGANIGRAQEEVGNKLAGALNGIAGAFIGMAKEQQAAENDTALADLQDRLQQKYTDWQQNNQGFNATASLGGFRQAIDDEIGQGGGGGFLGFDNQYSKQAAKWRSHYLQSATVYAAKQHEVAADASYTGYLAKTSEAAVLNRDNSQAVNDNLGAIDARVREYGQSKGLDADAIDEMAKGARGRAVSSLASAYISDGYVDKALSLYETNKDKVDAGTLDRLNHSLTGIKDDAVTAQYLHAYGPSGEQAAGYSGPKPQAPAGVTPPQGAEHQSPDVTGGRPPAQTFPDEQAANMLQWSKAAIARIESGGSYSKLGPKQKNGDYAIGKYQVMASNVPEWTQRWVGRPMTPEEFRASPEAQEKVFEGEFGSYIKKYGASDAAAKWFTGRTLAQAGNAHDSLGTSAPKYVAMFNAGVKQASEGKLDLGVPKAQYAYDTQGATRAVLANENIPLERRIAIAQKIQHFGALMQKTDDDMATTMWPKVFKNEMTIDQVYETPGLQPETRKQMAHYLAQHAVDPDKDDRTYGSGFNDILQRMDKPASEGGVESVQQLFAAKNNGLLTTAGLDKSISYYNQLHRGEASETRDDWQLFAQEMSRIKQNIVHEKDLGTFHQRDPEGEKLYNQIYRNVHDQFDALLKGKDNSRENSRKFLDDLDGSVMKMYRTMRSPAQELAMKIAQNRGLAEAAEGEQKQIAAPPLGVDKEKWGDLMRAPPMNPKDSKPFPQDRWAQGVKALLSYKDVPAARKAFDAGPFGHEYKADDIIKMLTHEQEAPGKTAPTRAATPPAMTAENAPQPHLDNSETQRSTGGATPSSGVIGGMNGASPPADTKPHMERQGPIEWLTDTHDREARKPGRKKDIGPTTPNGGSGQSDGEQSDSLVADAVKKYPFLKQYNPAVKVSPREDGGFAETFPPGEEGAGAFMRPKEFPMDRTGVEIYRPGKFSADDLAAEFLHVDPKAHEARAALIPTLSEKQLKILKNQPDYENVGGHLSDEKRLANVVDSMMRGYTVGQWPKHAIDELQLSDKQRAILDGLKNYMTGKGETKEAHK